MRIGGDVFYRFFFSLVPTYCKVFFGHTVHQHCDPFPKAVGNHFVSNPLLRTTIFNSVVKYASNNHIFAGLCPRQNNSHDEWVRDVRNVLSFALLLLIYLVSFNRKTKRLFYFFGKNHKGHFTLFFDMTLLISAPHHTVSLFPSV